jgi:hypothetical protein
MRWITSLQSICGFTELRYPCMGLLKQKEITNFVTGVFEDCEHYVAIY